VKWSPAGAQAAASLLAVSLKKAPGVIAAPQKLAAPRGRRAGRRKVVMPAVTAQWMQNAHAERALGALVQKLRPWSLNDL
jgi:hypothetical protein